MKLLLWGFPRGMLQALLWGFLCNANEIVIGASYGDADVIIAMGQFPRGMLEALL